MKGGLNSFFCWSLGSVALRASDELPVTEDRGPAFGDGHPVFSADIPADWLRPGLQLRAASTSHTPSAWHDVAVGIDAQHHITILPFYLFGATPQNTLSLAQVSPSDERLEAMKAVWPVSEVTWQAHPAGSIIWPDLVIGPRDGNLAFIATDYNQPERKRDGFSVLATTLDILRKLHDANGDTQLAEHYYAPLIPFGKDSQGQWVRTSTGGGIAGGDTAVGNHSYEYIYLHELGHSFGLPHASGAFDKGTYPYPSGSLAGSAWANGRPLRWACNSGLVTLASIRRNKASADRLPVNFNSMGADSPGNSHCFLPFAKTCVCAKSRA